VLGEAEQGDSFGNAPTILPIRHNDYNDPVTGVPFERYGQVLNGAIEVLPGSVNGTSTAGIQMLGGAQMAGGSDTFYAGWTVG